SYIEAVKEAALPISRIAKKKSGKWICECGKDLGSDPTRWTTVHVQQHEGSKDHTGIPGGNNGVREDTGALAITANLERFVSLYKGEKRVIILQMDELATEQRARYDQEGDNIVGLCVQCTPRKNTKFGGVSNLEEIAGMLDKGECHIGHQHTVISAAALGDRPYHAVPLLALAVCNEPNPLQQQLALRTILDVWNSNPAFGNTLGPIVLVCSDGDAVRRKVLHDLTSGGTSDVLNVFKLMDKTTSVEGLMQCFDLKHCAKRYRTKDISKKGVRVSGGLALNRDTYPELFRVHDGNPEATKTLCSTRTTGEF
ncbi:unnamed protein product, partial [Ectocarpus fasciculatus]